jgi:hypothetical protein
MSGAKPQESRYNHGLPGGGKVVNFIRAENAGLNFWRVRFGLSHCYGFD